MTSTSPASMRSIANTIRKNLNIKDFLLDCSCEFGESVRTSEIEKMECHFNKMFVTVGSIIRISYYSRKLTCRRGKSNGVQLGVKLMFWIVPLQI